MIFVETIKKAKAGDHAAVKNILNLYNDFCFYMINKYKIEDKQSCYEEVKRNIMKAIYTFKM